MRISDWSSDVCSSDLADGTLDHAPGIAASADETVVRPASAPFEAQGGQRLLRGNLGSALIKLSAVNPEFRSITAPAVVVDAPQLLNRLPAAVALPRDLVAFVRSSSEARRVGTECVSQCRSRGPTDHLK